MTTTVDHVLEKCTSVAGRLAARGDTEEAAMLLRCSILVADVMAGELGHEPHASATAWWDPAQLRYVPIAQFPPVDSLEHAARYPSMPCCDEETTCNYCSRFHEEDRICAEHDDGVLVVCSSGPHHSSHPCPECDAERDD